MIRPVILCGGSGLRLWPKSRESHPKQFIEITPNQNLLDLTLERIKNFKNFLTPIIVCSSKHNFYVKESAKKACLKHLRILEPFPKNTTAAIFFAAKFSNPNDYLLIMPSDHFIKKTHILKKSIENLEFDKIKNNWVLFGIKPTHPATSYGYIITKSNSEKQNKELMHIKSFSEKPNLKKQSNLYHKIMLIGIQVYS